MQIPLVFLTYINPIFTYGCHKVFLKNCQDCQVSGVIIPDVPFEEKQEVFKYCKQYDVDLIFIAPTSEQRIKMIAKEATGYIYVVSSLLWCHGSENVDYHGYWGYCGAD